MEASQFSSFKYSAPYTICCEGDVHCGIWHWRGNTAPCCTCKADSKYCLLLHIPAAPPLSRAQENVTLGGTEHHHSSWQCKESRRCCCHGPLVLLAMWNSGKSTVLIWYESMWLQSLRKREKITLRDPVQHKRWTYPCCRMVNMEHQQGWMRWLCTTSSKLLANVISKRVTILKVHKCCTSMNKDMSEISNCYRYILSNPCS